jgi:hypothetical protein
LQYLEDRSTYARRESIIETFEAPRFIRQIVNLGSFKEGGAAHLAGEITPASDPDLRTEWRKDGRSVVEGRQKSFGIPISAIFRNYPTSFRTRS